MKSKNKIPNHSAQLLEGRIPEKVTQFSDYEKNYMLSFKHYNDKLCEIDSLVKNIPKECIKVLKRVSQTSVGNLSFQNIDQIQVSDSGEYSKLYNKLTKDVQIFEHKIQGTARLFYFISAHEFNIVAITNAHLETKKVRR